jgi:hypothetical protein
MALFVLILVVLFAPQLITRAGALAVAVASGAALHAAGMPAMMAIGAGLVLYVGADAVLNTLAEHGGAAGRAGADSCSCSATKVASTLNLRCCWAQPAR